MDPVGCPSAQSPTYQLCEALAGLSPLHSALCLQAGKREGSQTSQYES